MNTGPNAVGLIAAVARNLRATFRSGRGCSWKILLQLQLGRQLLVVAFIVPFFGVLDSRRSDAQVNDRISNVFSSEFSREQDRNADRQPDGWTRKRDREHPSFIRAGINARDAEAMKKAKETEATLARLHHAWTTGKWNPNYVPEIIPPKISAIVDKNILNDCFEVHMDGGAFELVSPRFDIDGRYDYMLEGELDCRDLVSHESVIELRIFDRDGSQVGTYQTASVTGTESWRMVRTSHINTIGEGMLRGEIHLIVQQTAKQYGRGVARFDNIHLQRMPTLTIKTNLPNNITAPKTTVDFACFAAGLSTSVVDVQLTVTDIDGKTILQDSKPLLRQEEASLPPLGRFTATSRKPTTRGRSEKSFALFSIPFEAPGLYRVHATVGRSNREVVIAVLEPNVSEKSPFGISLPTLPDSSEVPDVISLAQAAQLGWLKLPIWYDETNQDDAKAALSLTKGLKNIGVKTVGRLDGPPKSQYVLFEDDPSRNQAVQHMQNPKIWEPLLDPVFTQLNSYLDFVQLGSDSDTSFMLSRSSTPTVEKVRAVFQYYFQDPKLVVMWDWLIPTSSEVENETAGSAINALHFYTETPLSAAELKAYSAAQSKQRPKLWVSIEPLRSATYSLHDRVEDLLEKMIAVKLSNVQAAFLTSPFDDQIGLLDEDQMPTEILVPWAQIAAAIGPRNSVGSIELPSGSQNVTFQGQNRDVMVLWNSRPVAEQFYFGENVTAQDVWGRSVPVESIRLPSGSVVQRIPVGTWPVIVHGVDCDVIRWRQEFQLMADHLASHLSSETNLPMRVQNTFNKRAKGSLVLRCDSLLKGGQSTQPLDIEAGRMEKLSFPLDLRSDASAGTHQIEFQFKLQTDKDYDFSVYRSLNLGHPDIEFRWDLVRLSDEIVEARIELINKTQLPVDFDCTLFPKDQAYLRVPMFNTAPGTTTVRHRLAIPRSASGQPSPIWIRCEQVRSPLTLNYLVTEKKLDVD